LPDLSVTIGGIKFKNPVMASAGEPTTDYAHMKAAIEAGAGGVVAKSVAFSPELAKSFDHARWAVVDENRKICSRGEYPKMFTFYGRGGIPLEPPDWIETLRRVQEVADKHGSVLVGSIGTGPLDKMVETAVRMERAGLRIIELDAGCPQVSQLGLSQSEMELVKSHEIAGLIAKSVIGAVSVPVIYKVAAEGHDIIETCRAVKEAGAAGATLINRYVGFLVDIESGKPHLNSMAGVGGPWVLPLTLRWVSQVYRTYPDLPIFGSNGAYDWQDVVQFLMSGASMAQFCSTLMLKGYRVITEAVQGLEEFMDRCGYSSIDEMVGLAVKNSKTYEELYAFREKARVDQELCSGCRRCLNACFYQGLEMVADDKVVITENCKGCGMCVMVCPDDAIRLSL
jgi:dihydroorotate dehydrogenase (fumarate)/dihydropyrimidine dehydrogenase (NAD+) subunit PreA